MKNHPFTLHFDFRISYVEISWIRSSERFISNKFIFSQYKVAFRGSAYEELRA